MKKIVMLLLVMTMSLTMFTGCGEAGAGKGASVDKEGSTEKQDDAGEESEDADTAEDEEAENSNVRKNGALPNDKADLTEEEVYYHLGKIFRAFQKLDIETLAEYTNSEYTLEKLETLRNDAEALEFFNMIVGDMVYFEDCDLLLAKSSDYIFTKWYTDAWKSGAELPDDVEDLDRDETLAIYEKYYAEAPWVCGTLADNLMGWDATIENGYLKCNLDRILNGVGYEELDDIMEYGSPLDYADLLMGEHLLSLGYDHIKEDMPNYQTVLSMNLDDIVALIEAELSEEDKAGFWYDCYAQYYVPEASRAVLQQYFDENVECYRELSHLWACAPANFEDDYPLYHATDKARAEMEKYNIVHTYYIYEFTESFDNNFDLFYNVAELLLESGKLQ